MSDRAVLDAIYRDAVGLADRARGWFDGPGRDWRARLAPDDQAAVAIESLAITARLMAALAWLLDPATAPTGAPPPAPGHPGRRPFDLDPGPDLPPHSPLVGQPGGDIAQASRALVTRLAAAAAASQEAS